MAEPWGLGLGAAVVLGTLLGFPALIVMAAVVIAAQAVRGRYNPAFILLIVACAALGAGRAAWQDEPVVPVDLASSTAARLHVESLPRMSRAGTSVLVSVRELRFGSHSRPGNDVTVLAWLPDGERVAPGDALDVEWSIEPLEMIDPGYGSYVESRGTVAVGRIWQVSNHSEGPSIFHRMADLRHTISDGLERALPGDAGALASGIVTGDDSRLSESVRDAFLRTGTTHITAVSGANIAMVLAIWNLVIPTGRNRRLIAVQAVIIVSIWMYAVLVGLEPPALRAAIMASLILVASRSGRRPDLLTLLALTSAGLVLWNPDHVRMVGFWLSVIATGAIIMRVPRDTGAGGRQMFRGMLEGVALAQIATLPVIIFAFGTWSLTSIFANAILSPLMWLAFPLCFLLAATVVVLPWIAPIMALAPLIPLELALSVVAILGSSMPPLDFTNAGLAGIAAISLPCVVGLALLSSETGRWSVLVARQWRARPVTLAIAVIGPAFGFLTALLIVLVRA